MQIRQKVSILFIFNTIISLLIFYLIITMQKNVIILGAGGHGVLSLKDLLVIEDFNFKVYYNTTDWGGSFGLWGRLLEHNKEELNCKLHNYNMPILPFADPNKLLCYYIEKNKSNKEIAGDIFNFRSNNHKDHITKIDRLFDILKFDNRTKSVFIDYFDTVWFFYKKHKFDLKYKNEMCLSYILQSFLHFQKNDINGWNNFYHNLEILPKNIQIRFSNNERNILVGKDISLVEVIGEDLLDIHNSPLLPDSIRLKTKNGINTNCCQQTIKDIEEADCVIIPNGSVANWLPMTNDSRIKDILKTKKLIWITNPYRTHNELINPNYHLYLKEIGLEPIPLAQLNGIHNNEFKNILEQDKSGKYNTKQLAHEITKIIL